MRHRQTLRQFPVVSRCALIVCAAALTLLVGASQASAQATPCADLFISDIDVNPDPPIAGTPTVISVTVHNGGTCTAPGFVVQWRRDRFASTGPSKSVASLPAGESATVVVSSDFTYPNPGNFQSIAEVDTGSAVSETNENNNLEQRSITVVEATRNLTVTGILVLTEPRRPRPADDRERHDPQHGQQPDVGVPRRVDPVHLRHAAVASGPEHGAG